MRSEVNPMRSIPILLDGDPGHDDAIAWVLARASRELGILAVTSCCGNQTIEKTTYNALRVCTLIGLHAPVWKGCPHPLLNDVMNAPSVHGESGLDGPALPEPAFEASALSAPELGERGDDRECDGNTGRAEDGVQQSELRQHPVGVAAGIAAVELKICPGQIEG